MKYYLILIVPPCILIVYFSHIISILYYMSLIITVCVITQAFLHSILVKSGVPARNTLRQSKRLLLFCFGSWNRIVHRRRRVTSALCRLFALKERLLMWDSFHRMPGTVCNDMVWYCMVWYSMEQYGMIWYCMVSYGMVQYGMVWYGMVWYGMVWYGMVWYSMV